MANLESTIALPSTSAPNPAELEAVVFEKRDPQKLALRDFLDGFRQWPVWLMLAYQDIKVRYRRSVLGPFWITLSMAITVYSMGYLYGHLFHSDLKLYYPFLVGGMLAWSLLSCTLVELVEIFVTEENRIKQIKLPYTLYINKVITRNFITFFHNLPILIPILLIFHDTASINGWTLLLIPGLALTYFNALTYGLSLAMIGARYRDVAQIVKSLIQVVFFVTPVMWNPEILPPAKRFIAYFNPFYSFIEIIRSPLIGKPPALACWLMVAVMTLLGAYLSFHLFSRYRTRIIYWL